MMRPKKTSSKIRYSYWLALFAAVTVFYVVVSALNKPKKPAPHPPASADDLLAAAKSMRLSPWQRPRDLNPQLVAWGERMFFDSRFSQNGQISCSTCHNPDRSFTDGKRVAAGVGKTAMNAPTLINAGASHWFFHNGRADSLEMQAMGPMENPLEHGFTRIDVWRLMSEHYKRDYETHFGPLPQFPNLPASIPSTKPPKVSDAVAAYSLATLGDKNLQNTFLAAAHRQSKQPIEILKTMAAGESSSVSAFDLLPLETQQTANRIFANFAKAVAAYERTIHTEETAFDRFADRYTSTGNAEESFADEFGSEAFAGFKLFVGEGGCALCHQGPHLSDQQFHNIGLPAQIGQPLDLGRAQGVLLVRQSPFNCQGPYLTNLQTESCKELDFLATENSELVGAFKTPTLRNLPDTAPYGHDGRFATLREVLIHYNDANQLPAVGHREESLQPLSFSALQLTQIEAFLHSLHAPVHAGSAATIPSATSPTE